MPGVNVSSYDPARNAGATSEVGSSDRATTQVPATRPASWAVHRTRSTWLVVGHPISTVPPPACRTLTGLRATTWRTTTSSAPLLGAPSARAAAIASSHLAW